ncbi:F-box protein SKIP5 [Citrus sinensis]|uniref:F-box protein SKIP5 isoform X2 n=1 Tax=Citrus clementina TaxID=85681 RepID=UPI000CED6448|nr:F-box protein SKIP5 isoform X2 [Citrus x clementina]XP_052288180.1 F-box protein SKIP5 isoform X2 [Citrus sinensis]KAH9658585.1 F-box protein SKIP5 [Citrus sinensis]
MEDEEKINSERSTKRFKSKTMKNNSFIAPINNLDDGCLMHVFSFLSPIPDRYNTALVCHRWNYLACHPRLWLRVDQSVKDLSEPGVFPDLKTAVSVARSEEVSFLMKQPLSVLEVRTEDTFNRSDTLIQQTLCMVHSALEFLSTCKLANLTVRAELGCCLLHRSGRLTIDGCVLQCETNPLDFLSCPIVSTARSCITSTPMKSNGDSVTVLHTRIEGGAKAVLTSGDLVLQRVRVIYARTYLYFWFDVDHQ